MAAETIAGRKLPRNLVYVGGAATVGILGYAWWTKGTSGVEEPIEELPLPVEEPTDVPGFEVTGGGPPPTTNADWSELATERLIAVGYDGQAVRSALGQFLTRQPLDNTEADIVAAAIGAAGNPPQNGPWVIIKEPTPTMPPPSGKPAISSTSRKGSITFSWPNVPGALGYDIRRETSGNVSGASRYHTNSYTWKPTKKGGGYRLHVRAVFPNNQYSDWTLKYAAGV